MFPTDIIKGHQLARIPSLINIKIKIKKILVLFIKAFIKGLKGILPGGISIKDYAQVAETDQSTAKKILDELIKNGIGVKEGNSFSFNSSDKLKSALLVLQRGAIIDEVSAQINWKDFEILVAEMLGSKGFETIRNLILKNPRMEIDVIGMKMGIDIVIDCKHWKRTSISSLQTAVDKQIERTKRYISHTKGNIAIPTIVTLYQEKVDFVKKVPIVPIQKFSSFVDEFYGNLDELKTIKSY